MTTNYHISEGYKDSHGGAENAGGENDGREIAGHEIARHERAGYESDSEAANV